MIEQPGDAKLVLEEVEAVLHRRLEPGRRVRDEGRIAQLDLIERDMLSAFESAKV
jgi:hypothetical protein